MNFRTRVALAGLPALFAFMFVAWPLVAILKRGFVIDGSLDLGAIVDIFGSDRSRSLVTFTVVQAAVSTLATLIIGLPAAWSTSRPWWGASLVRSFMTTAFVLPTLVMALAFSTIFDRGLLPIVLSHAAFNVAVVVRIVGNAWAGIEPGTGDAARTLGASRFFAWRTVTLARLAPAIASSAILTFLFSLTSFGVVLVLGDYRQGTIETEIYRLSRTLQFDKAGALAVVQLFVVGAALSLSRRFSRNPVVDLTTVQTRQRAVGVVVPGLAALMGMCLVAIPLGTLACQVFFRRGQWTLNWWRALTSDELPLGVDPLASLGTSFHYAIAATFVAVVIGGATAFALAKASRGLRLLDGLLMLPLGVSAVTLGYGYLITFDEAPLRLRDFYYVVPLAHAAVAVPIVVWVLTPAIRGVAPGLREAAATLGATRAKVFWNIELSLVAPSLGVAAGFAAAISIGEFGATALLGRSGTATAPFAIGRLLSVPGETARLAAFGLALSLALSTTLLMLVIDKLTTLGIR